MIRILLILIAIFTSISCDDNNSVPIDKEITKVSYGTSFGECVGYCIKHIEVSDVQIKFYKYGWEFGKMLPEININDSIKNNYFQKLVEQVDFNAFTQLQPVIGCPDCADGGAEWIEIQRGDSTYKVTFEYYNEPAELTCLVNYLRTYIYAFRNVTNSNSVNFNTRTFINQKGKIRHDVCNDNCLQYLIEVIQNKDTSYYYDVNLKDEFKQNGLKVYLNGTAKFDSTNIYGTDFKKAFKARNIHLETIEETK